MQLPSLRTDGALGCPAIADELPRERIHETTTAWLQDPCEVARIRIDFILNEMRSSHVTNIR